MTARTQQMLAEFFTAFRGNTKSLLEGTWLHNFYLVSDFKYPTCIIRPNKKATLLFHSYWYLDNELTIINIFMKAFCMLFHLPPSSTL